MRKQSLREYIELVVEQRVREADITGDKRVTFGDVEHIKDLETRITSLTYWRDKQKKGTEARANYARLITRLKSELLAAKRAFAHRVEGR